jgi:hypothetical protein
MAARCGSAMCLCVLRLYVCLYDSWPWRQGAARLYMYGYMYTYYAYKRIYLCSHKAKFLPVSRTSNSRRCTYTHMHTCMHTHIHSHKAKFPLSTFFNFTSGKLNIKIPSPVKTSTIVTGTWNVTAYSWDGRVSSPRRLPVHIFPSPCSSIDGRGCSPEGVYDNACDEPLQWEHMLHIRVRGVPARTFPESKISISVCIICVYVYLCLVSAHV